MRKLIRGLIPALVLTVLPVFGERGRLRGRVRQYRAAVLPFTSSRQFRRRASLDCPATGRGRRAVLLGARTWVSPPAVGVLWTPGYWGWVDGVYLWHAGYWGPHIGFYGGVNYGFGYGGVGCQGGYWRGGVSLTHPRSTTCAISA